MKVISTAFLTFCLCLSVGVADAAAPSASVLLRTSGIKGGLCLVVGAKDTVLAEALVGKMSLYVQLLQADARKATAWGAKIVLADCRENIGVRSAAFNADDYGSDLFNLIVVLDAGAVGKAKLADINRILVPGGVVIFVKAPAAFSGEARTLKMTSAGSGGFRKAPKTFGAKDWKPCDILKWRAGTRTQHCGGYADFVIKNGTISYLERMEIPGELMTSRAQLVIRDAYNGRVLSCKKVASPPNWRPTRLAASIAGRKLVKDPDRKSHWAGGCYKGILLGDYLLTHYPAAKSSRSSLRLLVARRPAKATGRCSGLLPDAGISSKPIPATNCSRSGKLIWAWANATTPL